jgi:hypothetical protein
MKLKLTHIVLAFTALLAMSSCTHNNGDIGLWFGLWHLDSIEIDGEPDSDYDGNYYFLFQGKVFCVRYVNEESHNQFQSDSFALWSENAADATITINFVDNRYSPRVSDAFPDPHLSTVTTMNVVTLTSKNMVLSYLNPDTGVIYTYHLTHWQ